jgi:hypothetical protein
MRNIDALPMAPPDRERDARQLFPLDIPPEEYAARHAHEWVCFGFDDYRYSDVELQRWIHRLGDILFRRDGAPSVDELRHRYLTEAERLAAEKREREPF